MEGIQGGRPVVDKENICPRRSGGVHMLVPTEPVKIRQGTNEVWCACVDCGVKKWQAFPPGCVPVPKGKSTKHTVTV